MEKIKTYNDLLETIKNEEKFLLYVNYSWLTPYEC